MRYPLLALLLGFLIGASAIFLGMSSIQSTGTAAPSDFQATTVPKTATVKLQMHNMTEMPPGAYRTLTGSGTHEGEVLGENSTAVWIPLRSLKATLQSGIIDVSQYRHMSVLVGVYNSTLPVSSSNTTALFAQTVVFGVAQLETFVTFVDPDTGAVRTVKISDDQPVAPVLRPQAFVSIGSGKTAPEDIDVVAYLYS
ncbi:hypothetical protein [Candidatus Nitrososphaera sp. FF02]|uniref:hypothetical protein n=1 Tax=Candidatus Nitrososphaera sp. FF02 TaxID=3398226 RepID=UPI0039EA2DDD